jgi:hypothetical protein
MKLRMRKSICGGVKEIRGFCVDFGERMLPWRTRELPKTARNGKKT